MLVLILFLSILLSLFFSLIFSFFAFVLDFDSIITVIKLLAVLLIKFTAILVNLRLRKLVIQQCWSI